MASGDMFLKLESQRAGVVVGESTDSVHPNQIEVLGWSWGMTTSQTIGGAGAGSRSSLSELRISKLVDTATTSLMSVMRTNDVIKEAVLTVRKAGGVQIDFLIIKVKKGRITSYDISAPSGPVVAEEFSIAFEEIEVEYHAQDSKGARKGGSSFVAEVRSV
ncbi:type VI secretion system tube protein Hcp [Ramlibacter sp. WS9]|nr:type VI secretion system tube protein Hcp [Ramlibacter sp. WS9]